MRRRRAGSSEEGLPSDGLSQVPVRIARRSSTLRAGFGGAWPDGRIHRPRPGDRGAGVRRLPRPRRSARTHHEGTAVPSFRAIAGRPNQTPQRLQSFIMTPHRPMPGIPLSLAEVNDVVAYLLSLR